MIRTLPWLVPATTAAREALKNMRAASSIDDLPQLQSIATFGWDESELRTIGRMLDAALAAARAKPSDEFEQAGYVSFDLLIISSRTASHMADALRATALRAKILLKCRCIEYAEPESWIHDNRESLAGDPPDATLLSLDRRTVCLQSELGDPGRAQECVSASLGYVQRLVEALRQATGKAIIVQTLPPEDGDPLMSADAWLAGSPRQLTSEFNRALAAYAHSGSCILFDVVAIADFVGHANWYAGRYWYLAKFPFAPEYIAFYCHRLMQVVAAMLGKSRRVLVLDLDDTLWGGVVGDDGTDGLVLGPGSARGEAYIAMQRAALNYKARGILLCVASRNSESLALDAFKSHPEMLLRETDITMFRINWDDKANSILEMAETLDLGLDAFVFVDDNPAERKQVRDALPMVAVPELPADPAAWLPLLQAAAYFEQIGFSQEDRARADYYRDNARRVAHARTANDHRQFLESLGMAMIVSSFDRPSRARIAQIIAKSNQFNLTTRRYSEGELAELETASDIETLQIRLQDMFGDNGIVSVLMCRKSTLVWEIDTWIMSCRVLNRGVEQAALNVLAARARRAGAAELRGRYIPTARNGQVREHYAKLGFVRLSEDGNAGSTWSLRLDSFVPSNVPIEVRNLATVG